MKKKICLVCCREGSKGIPNKNIIIFKGKPLLYWIFKEIKKSKIFDKIILSTDSKKIAKVGLKLGFSVPGLRPKYLSTDTSNVFDTHKYIFKKLNINDQNSIACIVNNNPFIKSKMIVKTYREYVKNKKKYITNLAKEIDLDQIFYRQCYIKNNSLIHIFKKDLLKSKINRNQIQKIYINLGEVRWGKISLLSDFMKYNINISKFGNKFILLGKENYVDINTKKDLNLAKRIFKKK